LAGVTAALLVGISFVTIGGGVMVFAALTALAVRPAWFGVGLCDDRLLTSLTD
jgi:hypothetical protein